MAGFTSGEMLIGVKFEWDGRKANANLRKHRLDFQEASSVFVDPLALTFLDEDHPVQERREITIGCTQAPQRRAWQILRASQCWK